MFQREMKNNRRLLHCRQRQTLSLAQHSLNEGVDICGLAFSSDGTRLYVGTEKGLAAFDINTVLRRGFEIGRIV